jgi:DNA-binding transcriptional regulator YhcF (GntR family)
MPRPVGIRELALLTNLHPHSVEHAIKSLREEKWISDSNRNRNRAGIRIQTSHPMYSRIRDLFEADTLSELGARTKKLDGRARKLCTFMDDGLKLIEKGRRSLHESE